MKETAEQESIALFETPQVKKKIYICVTYRNEDYTISFFIYIMIEHVYSSQSITKTQKDH